MSGKGHNVDVSQAPLHAYTTGGLNYQMFSGMPNSVVPAYPYGSWDAYTPRSWGMPMPLPPSLPWLSPYPSIAWSLALPSTPSVIAASAVPPNLLADLWTARQRQDEHSYLFDKLRSRDGTIRRRLKRLAHIDAELQQYNQQREEQENEIDSAADKEKSECAKSNDENKNTAPRVTRGQARELRRQMWWLQHQIQQVEQDEEQLFVRLGEIMAGQQTGQWLGQIRQRRYEQYGQQANWLAQGDDEARGHNNESSTGGNFTVSGQPSYDLAHVEKTRPRASQERLTETSSVSLTVDSSFVTSSPETPTLLATTTASSVSESAASAASVTCGHQDSMASPLSPLAPVFEPRQTATADRALVLAELGMHYVQEEAGTVFGEDVNKVSAADATDTSFVPTKLRDRRVSHSTAASPTSPQRKRISLPPVTFVWPSEDK
ncbi:hypothetical protein SEPCBS57363_006315 [Sporothrix epigloea]|uniref:Uncharacterized protein n=1 Tax=Sporothrix epigloea TaxID=1892477 RepID=A0ABP0E2E6_9PEZI